MESVSLWIVVIKEWFLRLFTYMMIIDCLNHMQRVLLKIHNGTLQLCLLISVSISCDTMHFQDFVLVCCKGIISTSVPRMKQLSWPHKLCQVNILGFVCPSNYLLSCWLLVVWIDPMQISYGMLFEEVELMLWVEEFWLMYNLLSSCVLILSPSTRKFYWWMY